MLNYTTKQVEDIKLLKQQNPSTLNIHGINKLTSLKIDFVVS